MMKINHCTKPNCPECFGPELIKRLHEAMWFDTRVEDAMRSQGYYDLLRKDPELEGKQDWDVMRIARNRAVRDVVFQDLERERKYKIFPHFLDRRVPLATLIEHGAAPSYFTDAIPLEPGTT